MSYTIIGYCPRCGSPLWVPTMWHSVTPPPTQRSCFCVSFFPPGTNNPGSGGSVPPCSSTPQGNGQQAYVYDLRVNTTTTTIVPSSSLTLLESSAVQEQYPHA